MNNLNLIMSAMDARLDNIKLKAIIELDKICQPEPKIVYRNRRYLRQYKQAFDSRLGLSSLQNIGVRNRFDINQSPGGLMGEINSYRASIRD